MPPSFQQQELQNEVQSIVRDRRANGESEEDVEKNKDQITAEANAKAIDKLRWFFAHKKIVEQEKIEVSREEVIRVVAMQAQQMGKDPQAYIKELAENNQIPTSKIDCWKKRSSISWPNMRTSQKSIRRWARMINDHDQSHG